MAKMKAPQNGIAVRMYRQGHGDCFLLALPRKGGGDPIYILIDCGYKPGSQKLLHGKAIGETVKHIGASTGNHLDLVIVTHEHEDHLNGFGTLTNSRIEDFTIDEAWFAWTEDPNDDLANQLRQRHSDQLFLLVEARMQLALAAGDDDPVVARLDSLLSLEFGIETDDDGATVPPALLRAAVDPKNIPNNKEALKLIRDKAAQKRGVRYLKPENAPKKIRGSENVRVFVLGPPRNEDLLDDLDPSGSEAFPDAHGNGHGNGHGFAFGNALLTDPTARISPFDARFQLAPPQAATHPFFSQYYGVGEDAPIADQDFQAAPSASWRRINEEWLYSAESLALSVNKFTNNTSLVLAFELPTTKKVLLFTGDAQRGNWISWDDYQWQVSGQKITTRDLLARTVLYKVGHHGSHNATLNGVESDTYPNLAWMGRNAAADEFTAMITAVNPWAVALKPHPWLHPWASIKAALTSKARGRVFQTDTTDLVKPDNVQAAEWQAFLARATVDDMYFEYHILDEDGDENSGDSA